MKDPLFTANRQDPDVENNGANLGGLAPLTPNPSRRWGEASRISYVFQTFLSHLVPTMSNEQ